ncbi:MAG TPA: SPFH domain-containing protein [Allosphingosinicella sp.]|nr:SPFH domain-containing protein [Allosphingosinicella sp.]
MMQFIILSFAALAVALLVAALALWNRRDVAVVYPPNVGLLYRDGQFRAELPPGRHVRFDPLKRTRIVTVTMAELPAQIGETGVLSKDQFSFRLSLAPVLKVTDPRLFMESQGAVEHPLSGYVSFGTSHQALATAVAAAAMEAAAARTLGEILADQGGMAAAVQQRAQDAIPGAVVERVLLAAINLPPETRKMFTDVERARMEGQAALERARGEQAALRVLANAARLLSDNPALANLRLLQAVESSKGATTIVIGNPAAALPGLAGQGPSEAGARDGGV